MITPLISNAIRIEGNGLDLRNPHNERIDRTADKARDQTQSDADHHGAKTLANPMNSETRLP